MRNWLILLFIVFASLKTFTLEAVLIDFNNLGDTTIDFSGMAEGISWTEEQKKGMLIDLDPKSWIVRVNSSSWTKIARDKTYAFPITNSQNYPDKTVLGVRIYFPKRFANSYAIIMPPFPIPSFYESSKNPNGMGEMFLGKGIVRNVGILRKLSVLVLGNNFKYSLHVRIQDQNGEQKDIFVGYLDFNGWKTKSWINPNIDIELKKRKLKKQARPHYPDEYSYIKFISFIIHRTEPQITGNFVTMIKEVRIEYDEAVLETETTENYQEKLFGIYKEELTKRTNKKMADVNKRIYFEWQERRRQHKEN